MLVMFQFKKCETVASETNFWWRQSQTLSNLSWMRWKLLKNKNINFVFFHTSKYSLTKYYYGKLYTVLYMWIFLLMFSCSICTSFYLLRKKYCWCFHVFVDSLMQSYPTTFNYIYFKIIDCIGCLFLCFKKLHSFKSC